MSGASEVRTYRKKPVAIRAVRLTAENLSEVAQWVGGAADVLTPFDDERAPFLLIPTLEGNMRGQIGDWVIRGVSGEYYPIKPDIFAETYELDAALAAPPDHLTVRFSEADVLAARAALAAPQGADEARKYHRYLFSRQKRADIENALLAFEAYTGDPHKRYPLYDKVASSVRAVLGDSAWITAARWLLQCDDALTATHDALIAALAPRPTPDDRPTDDTMGKVWDAGFAMGQRSKGDRIGVSLETMDALRAWRDEYVLEREDWQRIDAHIARLVVREGA